MELSNKVLEALQLISKPLKKLGSGQFGIVYQVTGKDGVDYALKVIESEYFSQLEFDCAQAVKGKSCNLIQVYSKVEVDSQTFILQELATGGTLSKLLLKKKLGMKFSTVDLMWQLLCGIRALHSSNILHRNIKPDDILLQTEKKGEQEHLVLKISDYGLSRFLGSGELAHTQTGTPMYMAPEIMNINKNPDGVSYNAKSDIYSCGLVFYVMATNGKHPFDDAKTFGDLLGLVQKPLPRPAVLTPGASDDAIDPKMQEALWVLIQSMANFDPSMRPTAEEALRSELFAIWGPPEAKAFIAGGGK